VSRRELVRRRPVSKLLGRFREDPSDLESTVENSLEGGGADESDNGWGIDSREVAYYLRGIVSRLPPRECR